MPKYEVGDSVFKINKIHLDYIGIFWFVDDKDVWICEKFDLKNEIHKSNFHITSPVSHPVVWPKYQSSYGNVKFNHYPRGRVNYQIPTNKFELDMDSCLNNQMAIDKLCRMFLLDKRTVIIINQNNTSSSSDDIYTCHNCRKM